MRLALSLILLVPAAAAAFEPGPTHPGLTARALVGHQDLHRFIQKGCGLSRGLFETLALTPKQMTRRSFSLLTRALRRLDPAGGYAPSSDHQLSAIGWALAGSVLAHHPATRGRHHFYCPPLRRGLDNGHVVVGSLLQFLSLFEGGDSVRQFFTGTGFDLTGEAATRWIRHAHNPRSIRAFHDALERSITGQTAAQRRHHLALAMMALGDLLHVLQDMASPTHVRDDFRVGHLQRLGSSLFNRGSAFERFVVRHYGQFNLPRYQGPAVRFAAITDFFSNSAWTGLADITTINHFSRGTLPPSLLLLPDSNAGEVRRRLTSRLPLTKPSLPALDLECLRRNPRCYLKGPHGTLVGYRRNRDRQVEFFLDDRCYHATARHTLPLAVGYSEGFVSHLVRAPLALKHADGLWSADLPVKLKQGKATLLVERDGRRTIVSTAELKSARKVTVRHSADGEPGKTLILVRGVAASGDPVIWIGLRSL